MTETETQTAPAATPVAPRKWQADKTNPPGRIQVNKFNRAVNALSAEHNQFIELSGVIGGEEHSTTYYSPFGCGRRDDVTAAQVRIGEKYGYTVSHDNVNEIVAALLAELPALEKSRPVKDERQTPEERAEQIAKGKKYDEERQAKAEQEAKQTAEYRAKWAVEYPYLERQQGSKKSSHALGAANIRAELARAFPGHSFHVTSDSSISVGWTLGPTYEAVKKLCDKYQKCDFDGMTDSETYRSSAWTETFGGGRYVSLSRSEGEGHAVVALALCSLLDLTPPADGKTFWNIKRQGDQYDVASLARQIILAREYPPGAVLTGCERVPDVTAGRLDEFYRATWTAPEARASADYAPVTSANGVTVSENIEKGGVEIRFPAKPSADVLTNLKAHGWRWSRFSSCWYKPASDAARAFANSLAGVNGTAATADPGPDRFDMQVEDNMRDACGA